MDRYLPRISEGAARWLRLAGVLAALLLVCWVLFDLRPVLTPLLVAAVLAYILNPVVARLEQRGVQRLFAVSVLFGVGLALLLIVGLFVTLKTVEQAVELRANIGTYVQSAKQWLATAHHGTGQPTTTMPAADWWQEIGPLITQHGVDVANATLGFLTKLFTNVLNWVSVFVLIPVYTFFFLWRFDAIISTIRDHLPAAYRPVIVHVTCTADRAVANFFRGRLIVCFLVGLATGLGWTLVGVPYGLPLGGLAGVLNLVPFMSVLALPPALVVTYFQTAPSGNWAMPVILVMVVYMAAQALESFVLSPIIESQSSGLHPLTTVLVLLIGAHWAGLLGMLLAIPVTSTVKVLGAEYLLPEVRRLATGPPGSPPPDEPPSEPPAAAGTDTDGKSSP
ncbi:MAG: AI-2E family transporter [Phycisphaerae bacterium]|jgi:predicted PurR-regulated permease PerM